MLLFTVSVGAVVQLSPVLPRNPDQLISRAQQFWAKMAAGQRAGAIQFVAPEMQDAFLASNQSQIQAAKVLGVDLGKNPEHATIRVQITVFPLQARENQVFIVSSDWVWRKNNWYVDVADQADLMRKFVGGGRESDDSTMTQKEIEDSIVLTQKTLDIGTVLEGKTLNLDVGIRYSGRQSVNVVVADQPAAFIRSLTDGDGITSKTEKFQMIIDTTEKYGELNIPVHLRFFRGPISVDRTLTVVGKIFSPVTFRLGTAAGSIRAGVPFSVFVRNNTDTRLGVQYFLVYGAAAEIVDSPPFLEPNKETEVTLRPASNSLPDRLLLLLQDVTNGKNQFIFRFNSGS